MGSTINPPNHGFFPDPSADEPPQLLGAACDFLAGEIDETAWLDALAEYLQCESILGGWWYIDNPDGYRVVAASGPEIDVPFDWVRRLDTLLDSTRVTNTSVIAPPASERFPYIENSSEPIFSANRLVAYIRFGSVRAVMIFSESRDVTWQKRCYARLEKVLPHIEKMLAMKARVNHFVDMLDLANKVFSLVPRGILTVMPDCQMVVHNRRADELLSEGRIIFAKEGKFGFCSHEVQQEMLDQLQIIDSLDRRQRLDYSWFKHLFDYGDSKSVLLTMRVLLFDRSSPAAGPYTWAVVITLADKATTFSPGEAKLREFYQMTPAEAGFVNEFMRTANIDEAAQSRKISLNTARSHLRKVYAKVGVKNKADLIRVLSQDLVMYRRRTDED